MTTLAELEDRVRAQLDEPVAAQWSPENLRRWFNDGLRDLARTTRHYKTTDIIALTAGVGTYTVGPEVLAIEHAYYDDGNQDIPLTARHFESMDQVWGAHQDWQAGWPQWFTTWGNSPTLTIQLYPVPTQTGANLRLLTAILPTEMPLTGADTDDVDVPPGWVDLIVDYAEMKALRRDRDPRWQEAWNAYSGKRNDLIAANDYLAVNREIVPDPVFGYVDSWALDTWW